MGHSSNLPRDFRYKLIFFSLLQLIAQFFSLETIFRPLLRWRTITADDEQLFCQHRTIDRPTLNKVNVRLIRLKIVSLAHLRPKKVSTTTTVTPSIKFRQQSKPSYGGRYNEEDTHGIKRDVMAE